MDITMKDAFTKDVKQEISFPQIYTEGFSCPTATTSSLEYLQSLKNEELDIKEEELDIKEEEESFLVLEPTNDLELDTQSPVVTESLNPETGFPYKDGHYYCIICNYKCYSTDDLQQHQVNLHSYKKSFQCRLCDYTTSKNADMNIHMRSHVIEKEQPPPPPPAETPSIKKTPQTINSIAKILSIKWNLMKFTNEVKLLFKKQGPPRPHLKITQSEFKNNKGHVHNFNMDLYKTADWLSGCDEKNAFFCFICLLMDTSMSDIVWTTKGVRDLKKLRANIILHQRTENHMNLAVEFNLLGRVDVPIQLNRAFKVNFRKHNENVWKNREILGKLIGRVRNCKGFDLAVQENGTIKSGLNLHAQVDEIIKEEIEQSELFSKLSETLRNNLLDSILSATFKIIKEELNQTQFVAIQVDEITDCENVTQTTLTGRYELNGVIYERFFGFVSITDDSTWTEISSAILNKLINFKIPPEKLIAQSYNSGLVLSIQPQIKHFYPECYVVHSYAHDLNLILERIAIQNKHLKNFFMHLEGFSLMFSKSPKFPKALGNVVKQRLAQAACMNWKFKPQAANMVYVYNVDILICLEEIIQAPDTTPSSYRKAVALKNVLQDNDFNYWLIFFNKLLPRFEKLINEMGQKWIEIGKVKEYIENFTKFLDLLKTKEEFEAVKRQRLEDCNHLAAVQVCNIIFSNIVSRFSCTNHIIASLLFEPELFIKHRLIFPVSEFDIASDMYNLDKTSFKPELSTIYRRNDFAKASGALALLQLFTDNNLITVFPESMKLLRIICTIPMMSIETERCLLTTKHLEAFTKNVRKGDKMYALAICAIEKELLQKTKNFNDLVIKEFVSLTNVKELIYDNFTK